MDEETKNIVNRIKILHNKVIKSELNSEKKNKDLLKKTILILEKVVEYIKKK